MIVSSSGDVDVNRLFIFPIILFVVEDSCHFAQILFIILIQASISFFIHSKVLSTFWIESLRWWTSLKSIFEYKIDYVWLHVWNTRLSFSFLDLATIRFLARTVVRPSNFTTCVHYGFVIIKQFASGVAQLLFDLILFNIRYKPNITYLIHDNILGLILTVFFCKLIIVESHFLNLTLIQVMGLGHGIWPK